jgi:hypothetical protein
MPLAQMAAVAIPPVPMAPPYTCHIATWYWAAMTAQAARRSTVKTPSVTLGNIATMAVAAQPAILTLVRSGHWDFGITPVTPPAGSVLLWPGGGTHSAVVTALNVITGYNQPVQFPHLAGQIGHTSAAPGQLGAAHRRCVVIAEETIVARAAQLDL